MVNGDYQEFTILFQSGVSLMFMERSNYLFAIATYRQRTVATLLETYLPQMSPNFPL